MPRLIGQTQVDADRKSSARKTTLWTVDLLRDAYSDMPNPQGSILRKVLDWAVDNGYYIQTKTQFPSFGLRGRSGLRIVSISSRYTYLLMEEHRYPGGLEELNTLLAELKEMRLVDPDILVEEVTSGRNLTRKLWELDERELEKFLNLLDRYCAS